MQIFAFDQVTFHNEYILRGRGTAKLPSNPADIITIRTQLLNQN